MVGVILWYELKQRFQDWKTVLFFLLVVFQGIWFTKGYFDYYANENLLINSPAVFYKNLSGVGLLMVIIVAIVTGTSLYKDLEYKTGQWIYTLPINEKQFPQKTLLIMGSEGKAAGTNARERAENYGPPLQTPSLQNRPP